MSLLKIATFVALPCLLSASAQAELRVGAAKIDITPQQLPVLVNGSMRSRTTDQITTKIHARAIVVDDGVDRIGLVVVDSCILPRHLLDEAKNLAAQRTQLQPERIMISATHTHSAPSSIGALGTNADETYVPFLRQQLAESLVQAEQRLQPAQVGWGAVNAPQFTALRRWVLRPDKVREDPFGNPTVRATMHAARNSDDAIGPTGPEDPQLSLVAFKTPAGDPIAVLANFSMHYFGSQPGISADYFGYFCQQLEQTLVSQAGSENKSDVVALMSHGCSGDIWRRDYMPNSHQEKEATADTYSASLVELAMGAYHEASFRKDVDIAMEQAELAMNYRVPSKQRLHWANEMVKELGGRLPETQPEIYAREQVFLAKLQKTNIIVQAIRIGDIGIVTTPCETYALTGLKLKLQSPLENTMVIELANGGEGYIPPPEQHVLGGYNTWAARSAGLEITAEPRIVAKNLQLLERLTGDSRRPVVAPDCELAQQIERLRPEGYWRLSELGPPRAQDQSGNRHDGYFEDGVVFFLDGPKLSPGDEQSAELSTTNRCAHFAGGRMSVEVEELKTEYTVAFSIWNGMKYGIRDVTGWIFSRDRPNVSTGAGLSVGLNSEGKLVLRHGSRVFTGRSAIPRWQWAHVVVRVSKNRFKVTVAGQEQPEIDWGIKTLANNRIPNLFLGGSSDNDSNWEGKLDEFALFNRCLTDEEVAALHQAATREIDEPGAGQQAQ